MKILIKGDRNVGKSCLLQRLQGGPFIEEYVPTDQIQVAPIHWTYKNTDYIVKVEVWEVVDKGRTKKKPPLGLKLENQSTASTSEDGYETPVLDATFLDVYKNANGVILMLDITKPWTFDYVVKELSQVPADLPVVVLGNHCDMQHHRQVHMHHIEQALHHAKLVRTAPVRYAESSMRNGFGLRLLHKFLSVPFLRLQKISLLEQLQRNQRDVEEIEQELDEFQNSEESHYNQFVDRLASKRRQSAGAAQPEPRASNERSPSIVLGAGKPIVPPNVNPLMAQSLTGSTATVRSPTQAVQGQYVNPELLKPKNHVSVEMTPPRLLHQDSGQSTPTGANISASSGGLDEFYAGTLDSSFLEDLPPLSGTTNQDVTYETDSDDENTTNPKVTIDQEDLDFDLSTSAEIMRPETKLPSEHITRSSRHDGTLDTMMSRISMDDDDDTHISTSDMSRGPIFESNRHIEVELQSDNDFPLWAGDTSARRSPEGGEDPDRTKEPSEKEKKHKKKKSKDKDRGDFSEKTDRKEKKHKHKKSKSDKKASNPQQDLLAPSSATDFNYEEYDSI